MFNEELNIENDDFVYDIFYEYKLLQKILSTIVLIIYNLFNQYIFSVLGKYYYTLMLKLRTRVL